MGRTITPTYRVEFDSPTHRLETACWNARWNGRATAKNLAAYVDSMNASFGPGGVNEHAAGTWISGARLIHQRTGRLVARYEAPRRPILTLTIEDLQDLQGERRPCVACGTPTRDEQRQPDGTWAPRCCGLSGTIAEWAAELDAREAIR